MRYRQFAEHVKAGVRRVGKDFTDPADDWAPFLFADFPDEGVTPIMLPPGALESERTKDLLAYALGEATKLTRPTKVAFVCSTWQVKFDKDVNVYRGDDEPRPSQHPRRFEAVMVLVVDAERVEGHLATIHRRRRLPPTLGPWEVHDPSKGELTGRFVEPLVEALR